MSPKEIGEMLQRLRAGEELPCPDCKEGKIKAPYNQKDGTYFECTKCSFKINLEPVNRQ